ncbi:metallophosphoesterase [Flavobacterium sp. MAH-1]|uniref:Metallophosphoesterase n=1 Tax=Flavobacterium agri TaxID=2743471 RepID=A0A7Y9C6M6_9FLAO|nr:metallophosphoesterase [Flavobacterium agri]NUY81575.1 metallophosphoesterase [Flavobacterium agri]NYA71599.1 metallophosphoesterase [Flavobacterium agri]
MFRWLFFILFVAVIETYAYQAFRTVTKIKWFLLAYQLISLFSIVYIIYQFTQFDRKVGQTRLTLFTLGLVLIIYIPKILLTVFMFTEDVYRMIAALVNVATKERQGDFLPERRKFISTVALGVASIPFVSLLYGMKWGKYNFKVIKQPIYFPDLPDAFDGFTICQISDVHSGSFDNAEKINYAIDLINEQQADMCLFTGDIVNTHATEMHPWIDTFNRIKSYKYGKFSVLGNHDYGEYVEWNHPKDKEDNFKAIKNLYGQIGFDLMLNEHKFIEKDGQRIALVGVENWGIGFKQVGDLGKASHDLTNDDFKILMSHDPSHWDVEVKNHPKNYQLTLAGHTHGLQFGIEIPGFIKWSPIQYRYPQWAGLYENLGRYLYVNRGFGFHAYPGRVGIWPEITVIELKKGAKLA